MLSDRRQRVLSALIEEYIARALPVGSRTLVERYKLGVSPATVRNELSILEDAGYIIQPHTSAGRVPTDFGYRAFVDDILTSGAIDEVGHEETISEIKASALELDELLEKTSVTLTRLTDCLSVVLAPSLRAVEIKQVSLVSLNIHQALVIVVTQDGQVINRHLEFPDGIESEDLAHVQNVLNQGFAGKTFKEIKSETDSELIEALQEPLTRAILEEVLSCLQESKGSRAHRLGISSLLTKPEFSHAQALLPIMQVLEDETVLLELLEGELEQRDTMVKIGSENSAEGLSGVSVVAGQYGKDDAVGIVAVIGPTRMDYSKVIGAVHAAQAALQDI